MIKRWYRWIKIEGEILKFVPINYLDLQERIERENLKFVPKNCLEDYEIGIKLM